jgi:methenyltetrahydrofolate cyclohydrolase
MLIDLSVRELLDAFASPHPTPGGGSAAAVASAIGASLLMMVAGLPRTRSNSEEDRRALSAARSALQTLERDLRSAVDEDTAAYDEVVAAYRLPKSTAQEQAARNDAVQRAMRRATEVPLQVMRLAVATLQHAHAVAAHGHRPAATDAGVAIALLRAGFEGARLNVGANVGSLTDAAYAAEVRGEAERLLREAEASAEAATKRLAS